MNTFMKRVLFLSLSTFVISFLTYSTNNEVVSAQVETGVDIGQKASSFKLLTVDGGELELGTFAEGKVTLLVFGATWCPSCRHEIPTLKEFYNDLKDDGLNLLGIYIQESEKKVKSFVEKKQINYPVALDSSADAAMLYKVRGIPLNIVLNKNGVIIYKEHVPPGKEVLEKLLAN